MKGWLWWLTIYLKCLKGGKCIVARFHPNCIDKRQSRAFGYTRCRKDWVKISSKPARDPRMKRRLFNRWYGLHPPHLSRPNHYPSGNNERPTPLEPTILPTLTGLWVNCEVGLDDSSKCLTDCTLFTLQPNHSYALMHTLSVIQKTKIHIWPTWYIPTTLCQTEYLQAL